MEELTRVTRVTGITGITGIPDNRVPMLDDLIVAV